MSAEHVITDHSRGWRCSCGEWLHASARGVRASTRATHLTLNDRSRTFIAKVKLYREQTGCTLKEAVDAVKASTPEAAA